VLKRSFDVAVSVCALVILAPILLFIALLIRVRLGSPVLFRQQRPGRDGAPFILVKFRTMLDARAPDGRLLPDADRLTPFGRLLRRTSLDELPELLNVVRGEMSLVGPRPLLMEYLPRYSARQARRHDVKPGITGWAQINGRNAISWEQKLDLDVWYVQNRSFFLDLKILISTITKTIRSEGISQDGHATMPEFMGTTQSGRENGNGDVHLGKGQAS
jgi:sugar transferase EpsL